MNILGSVGQLYMFVLLALLFMGSGFALWRFIEFVTARGKTKPEAGKKDNENIQVNVVQKGNVEGKKILGGLIMANNGWLKLAVVSFIGIFISVAALGLISTNGNNGMNIHQLHQQQGMQQNGSSMNMQGGMNMGNMQMQGNMNIGGGMQQNDLMMIQQQINQIQMQLNQMQGNMNGSMGSMGGMQQSGSMGNMGGMGMMGGMMNGMMGGMMGGMGNMNSMPSNSGGMNMQGSGNSSGSSSGSMSGMGMM
ncbi:MAG: hypothetical protein N3B21_10600 [Clostridia bacterium]|nr:hypothetical protein [Clostridia bacterium]